MFGGRESDGGESVGVFFNQPFLAYASHVHVSGSRLLTDIAGKSNAWQHAWQELRRSTYSQPWGSVQRRKERISNAMCVCMCKCLSVCMVPSLFSVCHSRCPSTSHAHLRCHPRCVVSYYVTMCTSHRLMSLCVEVLACALDFASTHLSCA